MEEKLERAQEAALEMEKKLRSEIAKKDADHQEKMKIAVSGFL